MRKTIPENTVVTCDICGGHDPQKFRTSSQIKIKRDALDWSGIPAADGSVVIDLCDGCAENLTKIINEAAYSKSFAS